MAFYQSFLLTFIYMRKLKQSPEIVLCFQEIAFKYKFNKKFIKR
jgi:hypothetical protein